MDSDEINILKNQDVLLNDINSGITRLLEVPILSAESVNSLLNSINEFQSNPQLLDKKLSSFINRLATTYITSLKEDTSENALLLQTIGKVIYNFSKVRGIELVSTLLSTNIEYFNLVVEKTSQLLQTDQEDWYELSFLLLWLSVLVLSPFKLDQLIGDSNKIYKICFDQLLVNSNSNSYLNDVNVLLFSKFLSRVDAGDYLHSYYHGYLQLSFTQLSSNQLLANLKVLLKLLKLINYDKHEDLLKIHYNLIYETFLKIVELDDYSPLILKLVIKNFGRMAVKFVTLSQSSENDDDESGYLQKIEDITSSLLSITNNKDTVVRYSNAKNLAKFASLLPEEFQLDILDSTISQLEVDPINNLLEQKEHVSPININQNIVINFELISSNHFHGFFLIIAEYLKRGMVSSSDSNHLRIIFLLIKPFFYFKKVQINSVLTGSNIRDSILYVVWNLLKYNTALLRNNIDVLIAIFKNLLFVVCFDNDLIIRRASSAVIQELVGRYGSIVWQELDISPAKANELSVKLVELLEFNKLNDFSETFLENSTILFKLIPEIQADLLKFLLSTDTNVLQTHESLMRRQGTSSGIFSIDKETEKLSSILLSKLLILKIEEDSQQNNNHLETVCRCIEYFLQDKPHFFAIAQLFNLIQTTFNGMESPALSNLIRQVKQKLGSITYNYHREPVQKGEEILNLVTTFLPYYAEISSVNENADGEQCLPESLTTNVIFNIIRQNSEEIKEAFQHFLSRLSQYPKILDSDVITNAFRTKLLYYIKNGNLISSESVGYLNLSFLRKHGFFQHLTQLLANKKTSYEIRVNILHSFKIIIAKSSSLQMELFTNETLNAIIGSLRDYTLSEQGDVGNKVRFEAINLIEKNIDFFILPQADTLREKIEQRLLRLISEVIDRIKYSAITLLIKLKFHNDEGTKHFYLTKAEQVIQNNNYADYYSFILDFYLDNYLIKLLDQASQNLNSIKEQSTEFLRGVCLTVGAIGGTNASVFKSTESLIKFFDRNLVLDKIQYEKLVSKDAKFVPRGPSGNTKLRNLMINDLLFLLRFAPQDSEALTVFDYNQLKNSFYDQEDKVKSCCLSLFVKLVDSGVPIVQKNSDNSPELDDEAKLIKKKIFIRLYNFEIKTKNANNLVNIVKLYAYLAISKIFQSEVMERFSMMLKKFSTNQTILVAIIEALYSIYIREAEILSKSDGSGQADKYKELIEYLESTNYSKIAQDVRSQNAQLVF